MQSRGVVQATVREAKRLYRSAARRVQRVRMQRVTAGGAAPPLASLAIEINAGCNRRCRWCPNSVLPRTSNTLLDGRLVRKVLDDARTMGFAGQVSFTHFNEPLLDRRLVDFIDYARRVLPRAWIYLNTNGDLLTLPLWRRLRAAGLDRANISQYDGAISEPIRALRQLLPLAERPHFHAYVFDSRLINNRAGLVTGWPRDIQPGYCSRPFTQLQITHAGMAVVCCNDYSSQVLIGDIRTRSVASLWADPVFARYRRALLRGDRAALDLCRLCDAEG